MTALPKTEHESARAVELAKLQQLLLDAKSLDNSTGTLSRLKRIHDLATELTKADLDTGRASFLQFLVTHLNSPTNDQLMHAAEQSLREMVKSQETWRTRALRAEALFEAMPADQARFLREHGKEFEADRLLAAHQAHQSVDAKTAGTTADQ